MQIFFLCNSGKHIIFYNSAIDIRKYRHQPLRATGGFDGNEVERHKTSDCLYSAHRLKNACSSI